MENNKQENVNPRETTSETEDGNMSDEELDEVSGGITQSMAHGFATKLKRSFIPGEPVIPSDPVTPGEPVIPGNPILPGH